VTVGDTGTDRGIVDWGGWGSVLWSRVGAASIVTAVTVGTAVQTGLARLVNVRSIQAILTDTVGSSGGTSNVAVRNTSTVDGGRGVNGCRRRRRNIGRTIATNVITLALTRAANKVGWAHLRRSRYTSLAESESVSSDTEHGTIRLALARRSVWHNGWSKRTGSLTRLSVFAANKTSGADLVVLASLQSVRANVKSVDTSANDIVVRLCGTVATRV